MNSMTGYGKGVVTSGGRTISIELKSVNNRYLEINSRLPKSFSFCDDTIRKEIADKIKRGSIDVFFNYENQSVDAKVISLDMFLASEYFNAAKRLRTEFCLEDDFNTTALIRCPDVVKLDHSKEEPELIQKLVSDCMKQAVKELCNMREAEGLSIHRNLSELMSNIITALKDVITRAPKVAVEYRQKLESRMKEILCGVELDQTRLVTEAAYFADKSDINEEISRLSSHINQFIAALDIREPQGRKLDFITQEMNREINTIGSKSNDIELTNLVIYMKNELEKIKEQIRNVE